jgi:hypothetical protein
MHKKVKTTSDRGRTLVGGGAAGVAQVLPEGIHFRGERGAGGDDIGAVDNKICARRAPAGLSGSRHPGVNASPDTGGAGATKNIRYGRFELGRIIALRLA